MISQTRLEEKLRELIDLRKKEEAEYGKLLSRLDEICRLSFPDENSPELPRIKDALNEIWDLSKITAQIGKNEERIFWKEVAQNVSDYVKPLAAQQREVNSVLVHLLNEYISAVHSSLEQIQLFQTTLILYFQRIIPVIDSKFREMVGTAEAFQFGLRDYMDALYQALDKKIETLQVDVSLLKSGQLSQQSDE